MSVFEKLNKAIDQNNAGAYIDLLDDDFVFVRHQTGTQINKKEMAQMLEEMLAKGAQLGKRRLIYENDDIAVMHSFNTYPDNTKEAVIVVHMLKDGKITRMETGATPLP